VRPTFGPPPLRPAAEAPGPITLPFTPPAAPAWDIHQLDLTGPGQMDVSAEQDLQQLVGAAPPPPPPGPFLRLLLAMNRVIDRLILFLGPLGTPLVTPAGRNLMGWIGLVCLVGAVALLAGGWLGRLR
jgi:hypothetical protein